MKKWTHPVGPSLLHSKIGLMIEIFAGLIQTARVKPAPLPTSRTGLAEIFMSARVWLKENARSNFPSAKEISVSSASLLPTESLPLSSPNHSATSPGHRAAGLLLPDDIASLRMESRSEEHTSELQSF